MKGAKECIEAVHECVGLVRNELKIPLPAPTIKFDLRGTTAGRAWYPQCILQFNPILMLKNEGFIAQTVPHEVAHLAAFHKYGMSIQPHGREWQLIMRLLGQKPKRCHNFLTKDKNFTLCHEIL